MNVTCILLLTIAVGGSSSGAEDLARARVALDADRPDDAERALRSAVLDPKTRVEALLIWGEVTRTSGRPDRARSIFRAVLRIDAGHPAARDGLALLGSDGVGPFLRDDGVEVGASEGTSTRVSADVDGDGWPDLVEADGTGLRLRRNDGPPDFTFRPRKELPAPHDGEVRAVVLADVDLDGDLDLIVAGGRASGLALGDGAGGYRVVERRWPAATAIRVEDADGDGDPDLALTTPRGSIGLRNATGPERPRLVLRLEPDFGARVTVTAGARHLVRDGARLPFGLGWSTRRVDVEIEWPTGTRQIHLGLPVGRWRLEEGSAPAPAGR